MITTFPITTDVVTTVVAEATNTTEGMTSGELWVTVSTVGLVLATLVMGILTYFLIKVSHDLVTTTREANKLAMKEIAKISIVNSDNMTKVNLAEIAAHHPKN